MPIPQPGAIGVVLDWGLVGVAGLWSMLSLSVLVNRLMYDRRERRLRTIADELSNPELGSLPPLQRAPRIGRILSRLSRRAVYRLVARTDLPEAATAAFAEYSMQRWGLERMRQDAAPGSLKWRRISALFALGHLRDDRAHDLLSAAIADPDQDIAAASVVVLHRLGDRSAAMILVDAIRAKTYAPSRIATQVERFPIPIADILRPLLKDPQGHARYWGALLLARYSSEPGVAAELAMLVEDPDASVRKATLETLGTSSASIAVQAARTRLRDPESFVRSTAIRALARHGLREPILDRRIEFAMPIARALADVSWDVRFAAKEALVSLGPSVWPVVAEFLESPDAFARNGAAEVLQNLRLLDKTIDEFQKGIQPGPELVDVLTRAFREGGPVMVDAAVARATPSATASALPLLQRLGFVPAT